MIKSYKIHKLKKGVKKYGSNFEIAYDTILIEPHLMTFGDNVFINRSSILSGTVNFGNNIMIGPRFTAYSNNHQFGKIGRSIMSYNNKYDYGEINIHDECWFGTNCTIIGNVTVGFGSVIGANALITKNIPPFSVVIANNNIIKKVLEKEEAYKHMKSLGYDIEYINKTIDSM